MVKCKSKLIILTDRKDRSIFNYFSVFGDFECTDRGVFILKEDTPEMAELLIRRLNKEEHIYILIDNSVDTNIMDSIIIKLIMMMTLGCPNISIYSLEYKKPIFSTKYNYYKILTQESKKLGST